MYLLKVVWGPEDRGLGDELWKPLGKWRLGSLCTTAAKSG